MFIFIGHISDFHDISPIPSSEIIFVLKAQAFCTFTVGSCFDTMWINIKNETASPAGPDSVHRKPSLLLCAPSPNHVFLSHQAGWQKQLLTSVVTAQTSPALPSRPRKGTEVSADSCHHQGGLWPSKTDRREPALPGRCSLVLPDFRRRALLQKNTRHEKHLACDTGLCPGLWPQEPQQ